VAVDRGTFADEDSIEIVADFVAAFEADEAEPLEDEPESAWNSDPDSDLWMPLSAGPGAVWPRLENACGRPRSAQDEWDSSILSSAASPLSSPSSIR